MTMQLHEEISLISDMAYHDHHLVVSDRLERVAAAIATDNNVTAVDLLAHARRSVGPAEYVALAIDAYERAHGPGSVPNGSPLS
jgi:hypothetical protein